MFGFGKGPEQPAEVAPVMPTFEEMKMALPEELRDE